MSEAFVITVTLPGTPEHFSRDCDGKVTIGRSPEADIQLVHPLVSRRHAEVSVQDDGRFLICDLDSRNGTVVNDELLQNDSRAVEGRPVVQVGPYMLNLASSSLLADETFAVSRPFKLPGRVSLDKGVHVLRVDGQAVIERLTGLEYRLMEVLTDAGRRLVPIQELGDAVWGAGLWDVYMLHNLVRRVRRKLEAKNLPADELIVSVPGGGYRAG